MKKKNLKIVAMLIIISLLVLTVGCSKPAATPATPGPEKAPEKINLKFATSWAKGDVNYLKAEAYAKTINELAKGKLEIKIMGGTDLFAPTETITAVMNGSMDGAYSSASYYEGVVPAASALSVSMLSHAQVEAKGGMPVIRDIYKKSNLMFANIDDMQTYCGFHIWLKQPIKSLDELKGKKLRTAPGVYSDIVKHYGASVVNTPLGEVFTALEQGLIDGYTVPTFIGAAQGFFQYAKYRVEPPMLGGGAGVVYNLNTFNKLPKDLQDLILSPETNKKVNEAYTAVNKPVIDDNLKKFEAAGGKVIQLTEEQKKDYFDVINKYSWEYVKKKVPDDAAALEKVLK